MLAAWLRHSRTNCVRARPGLKHPVSCKPGATLGQGGDCNLCSLVQWYTCPLQGASARRQVLSITWPKVLACKRQDGSEQWDGAPWLGERATESHFRPRAADKLHIQWTGENKEEAISSWVHLVKLMPAVTIMSLLSDSETRHSGNLLFFCICCGRLRNRQCPLLAPASCLSFWTPSAPLSDFLTVCLPQCCLSDSLSTPVSDFLTVCLLQCLTFWSTRVCLSDSLSTPQSDFLTVCLLQCLTFWRSVCPTVFLTVCLLQCLTFRRSVYPSVFLTVCLPQCLTFWPSAPVSVFRMVCLPGSLLDGLSAPVSV